jgi:hypothetical protein
MLRDPRSASHWFVDRTAVSLSTGTPAIVNTLAYHFPCPLPQTRIGCELQERAQLSVRACFNHKYVLLRPLGELGWCAA